MEQRHIEQAVRRVASQLVAPPPDELWQRVRHDPIDEDALRDLVDCWAPGFLSYCRVALRDAHAAEDVVSESFATLVRKRGRVVTAEDALRYTWRVAINAARRARRRRREQTADVTAAPDPREPADPAVRAELSADVAAALDRLSEKERRAVVLVLFLELTESDAAGALGCSRSSVRTHLARARGKLAQFLARWKGVASVAGGVVGVEGVLAEAARAGSRPALTSALAADILRRAALPVWTLSGWVKVAAVVAGLAGVGGVTWAAWPTPQPVPEPSPAARPPDPAPETLPARNRRVLEAETLPKVVEALRAMSPNGGEGRVTRLDVHDFRAVVEVELRHKDAPAGLQRSRFRFLFDTRTGSCMVFGDPWGRGEFRQLDVTQPIILMRAPELGIDLVLRSGPLEAAVAVLRTFPIDPRAEAAAVQFTADLDAALAPYRGTWRYRGLPTHRSKFATDPLARPEQLVYVPAPSSGGTAWQVALLIDPDGRVRLWSNDAPWVLSADGRRLDLPGTGHWWVRETPAP